MAIVVMVVPAVVIMWPSVRMGVGQPTSVTMKVAIDPLVGRRGHSGQASPRSAAGIPYGVAGFGFSTGTSPTTFRVPDTYWKTSKTPLVGFPWTSMSIGPEAPV